MIAITGASGFVGGAVTRLLGAEGRGIFRRDVPGWTTSELRAAIGDAHTVVHAASVVHRPDVTRDEIERFNVEGTQRLVEAARAAGVRRFVFVSSIKVHGECPEGGRIDESTPVRMDTEYARTKAVAEQIVLGATDLQPAVLRLCPVYGPGDKGNVRAMIRNIQRRTFFIPGDGSTRKSIVHVSTVANVIRRVAERKETGAYVVADRVTPTIRELADEIARALGRRRPRAVPRAALIGVAAAVGGIARAARMKTGIGRSLIEKATSDSLCDPSLLQTTFGLDCHVDLHDALREEIAWLRAESLLR